MRRMIFIVALIIGVAFSACRQTKPNEVYVVMVNGTEYNNYNRILGAFQQAIVDAGFKLGNSSSPYTLEVSLVFTEMNIQSNPNVFVRYDITANFIDTTTRQSLLPIYAIGNREGHVNLVGAQNRSFTVAEQKINEEYKGFVESNFSR